MKMTPTEVAETVLRDKGQGRTLPTNLLAIVSATPNLEFEPFRSPERFEGRLELRRNTPTLFLNLHSYDVEHPRVRFTLAHELGHFFLHRSRLRRGFAFHDSVLSHGDELPAIEREANEFASGLLLPTSLVKGFFEGKFLSLGRLRELRSLANTSWQATAIRLSKVCSARFCFFWEEEGRISWASPSDDWIHAKHPWSAWKGEALPERSLAATTAEDFDEREVPRSVWHPNVFGDPDPLFESAIRTQFGRLILVIDSETDTFLEHE